MALSFYNTLTRKKEKFEPLEPGKIGMYVCGVTVYDYCHIGHARSVVVFDVIYRYLKASGYNVTFVRNFTDIDDKIIQKANQEGIPWSEVAEKYIAAYYEDMDLLNIERPTYEPRATQFIEEMIEMVKELEVKGFAYVVDGDVYYSVEKFPDYGKLSGRKLEDMMAGARVEVDSKKKNPFDFALWKASKPGEPKWDSPWGPGRPGWHLECSVMSRHYLGKTFDIHGGGEDLIFPHHENEIAQSEAAHGVPFVRYWIHHGFVKVNKEKMSKSLGNFFTIREVLDRYHPEVLRLFLLSKHYKSPVDFSDSTMREAEKGLERIYSLLNTIREKTDNVKEARIPEDRIKSEFPELYEKAVEFPSKLKEDMDNDFNTAAVIGSFFELTRIANRYLERLGRKKAKGAQALLLKLTKKVFSENGKVLGLFNQNPGEFLDELTNKRASSLGIDVKMVEKLIEERAKARKEKDFARADEIRDQLKAQHVILEDTPSGTRWKVDADV